jgi:xylitol oxidase
MAETQKNWAGNYTYSTDSWHYPETVEQVQEIVRSCHKLRAVGARHSFNGIADSTEDMLSLAYLQRVLVIDQERQRVTVDGGMRYGDLCQVLHQEGYALHNLASLPHISVAGACATATHGSGDSHGNLATAVTALELVTAEGEVVTLSREQDGDQFYGAVVGLGALGVVTKVTLDIMPTFAVRQDVYEHLPLAQLAANFEEIFASGYSASLFTDWRDEKFDQLWLKRRVTGDMPKVTPSTLFGAMAAPVHRHPIISLSAENCTEQMGIPGPWYERLPHFRLDFTPSSGEELQTEYFVPRSQALAALQTVMGLSQEVTPLLLISEVRTVAADQLWLSPCYQQPCVAIHFTWRPEWAAVRQLLPLLEEKLAPFEARPHWGKLFTMAPAQLQSLYEKLPEFRQLAYQYDPQGKFRNAFLDRYIFGTDDW